MSSTDHFSPYNVDRACILAGLAIMAVLNYFVSWGMGLNVSYRCGASRMNVYHWALILPLSLLFEPIAAP